jgi:hypothetical protein
MRAVFGDAIKISRKAAAEPIGVGDEGPNELTLPTSLKPDPRLIAMVRILARQAARDFYSRRLGRPGMRGLPHTVQRQGCSDCASAMRKANIFETLRLDTKEYAIVAVRPMRVRIPQPVAGDLNLRTQAIDFVGATVRPQKQNPAIL